MQKSKKVETVEVMETVLFTKIVQHNFATCSMNRVVTALKFISKQNNLDVTVVNNQLSFHPPHYKLAFELLEKSIIQN
jgi:hypothetical protein